MKTDSNPAAAAAVSGPLPGKREYARLLECGTRIGIGLLAVAGVLYFTGWLPARLSPAEAAGHWSLKVHDYTRQTASPTGWAWVGFLQYSDYLCLAVVAFLTLLTLAGYGILVYRTWRVARVYAGIALAEILLLALAAAGVLQGGAH